MREQDDAAIEFQNIAMCVCITYIMILCNIKQSSG